MFKKLSLLAFAAPLVRGLSLFVPANPLSAASVTFKWTSQPTDPVFDIFLVNEEFHDSFAMANNVDPSLGEITITIPVVPVRGGYTVRASTPGNIGNVISETPQFSIGQNPSSSPTGSVSSATSTRSTSIATGGPVTTRPLPSTTSFGSTISSSGTASTSSGASPTDTAPPSGSSSAAHQVFKLDISVGALAAVFFSAVAGTVVVAL